jgi:hypothetical protein
VKVVMDVAASKDAAKVAMKIKMYREQAVLT